MTDATGLVLLAEDNPVNQGVATAMLEHLGFRVDVVSDGAEAVKTATGNGTNYQAILMDCQIPVMDGYVATGEIRRREGASRHTPIIAVTGSTDSDRCLAAGMDDYLAKPLSLPCLDAALARWAPEGSTTVVVDTVDVHAIPDIDPVDTAASTGPVLDAQVTASLERLGRATGEDLVGRLAALYVTEADALLIALREAIAEDDAPTTEGAAHNLRGASANLGATKLARSCEALEMAAAEGDLVESGRLLDAIELDLTRVRSALQQWIPEP